jgi:hypothetical protein
MGGIVIDGGRVVQWRQQVFVSRWRRSGYSLCRRRILLDTFPAGEKAGSSILGRHRRFDCFP